MSTASPSAPPTRHCTSEVNSAAKLSLSSKNGGAGPGVSPKAALKLGLKVDLAAVPKAIVPLIQAGTANLEFLKSI
jgi:hypothetical protein